jgi:hypothetical protein
MKKSKKVLEGPAIRIVKPLGRFEIVKKVVSHFIDFEKDKKGKGVEFRYPVETLSTGKELYIHRPGVKWNFDFKVEIPENYGLGEGTHIQIAMLLRNIRDSNQILFEGIWKVISDLYKCKNNDVDTMLSKMSIPNHIKNVPVDLLLKVIKWLFIMEDIIYWHYEGRAFLYNFFKYIIYETDSECLTDVLKRVEKGVIKPETIKEHLKRLGVGWEVP